MSLCDWDLDPVDCYSETKVAKSRKPHKCGDCYGTIAKGEGYTRIGYVFDGRGRTAKRCGDCQAIRCMIKEVDGSCSCLPIDNLCEVLQEEIWESWDIEKWASVFGAYNAAVKERGGILLNLPKEEVANG